MWARMGRVLGGWSLLSVTLIPNRRDFSDNFAGFALAYAFVTLARPCHICRLGV
jgi:hypothetical protein